MLAAAFAAAFGLSLLPGRVPLCMRFARRVSSGIVPAGAEGYCRRLTWFWFVFLLLLAAANAFLFFSGALDSLHPALRAVASASPSLVAVPLAFLAEAAVRRRRFSLVFGTSGSTGQSKRIVKTFESLARETAMHRDFYMSGPLAGPISRGEVVFIATIDPAHMYGTLWRTMLPAALPLPGPTAMPFVLA